MDLGGNSADTRKTEDADSARRTPPARQNSWRNGCGLPEDCRWTPWHKGRNLPSVPNCGSSLPHAHTHSPVCPLDSAARHPCAARLHRSMRSPVSTNPQSPPSFPDSCLARRNCRILLRTTEVALEHVARTRPGTERVRHGGCFWGTSSEWVLSRCIWRGRRAVGATHLALMDETRTTTSETTKVGHPAAAHPHAQRQAAALAATICWAVMPICCRNAEMHRHSCNSEFKWVDNSAVMH